MFSVNQFYIVIIENIFTFTSYQDLVEMGLEILLKSIKIKNNLNRNLVEDLKRSNIFYEATRKILKIHDCNMKIMTKIFYMISYLKSDYLLNLISITKLKNISIIYSKINFDLNPYLDLKKDKEYY